MKKNVASQKIGCQMVSATDGSAFTSAVTVYVTGDAGTQAAGSVGSGACTHEGNGYHTYAPAQAETNYDLVAFTFIGTGAVPATVQVFTGYPQTGDAYGRLGAPAGASVSADILQVKGYVDDIGVAGAGLTALGDTRLANLDAAVSSRAAAGDEMDLVNAPNATAITAIQAGLATPTNITAGTITTVTNLTNLPAAAATAAELAKVPKSDGSVSWNATAVAAIATETLTTLIIPNLVSGSLAEYVYDTKMASGYGYVISNAIGAWTGSGVNTVLGAFKALLSKTASAPSDIGGTFDPATDSVEALRDRGDAAWVTADVSALATAAALATVDSNVDAILVDTGTTLPGTLATIAGYVDTEVAAILAAVDTEVAAIKAKTDNLPAAPAATGDIPTAAAVADAVWDEAIAGHAGVGSTGEALAAAGSAGDPWATALPGAYGSGTAGKIIGDNINATVSSRAAAGDEMDLVDAPNATAVTAIQSGLATPTNITAGTITTVTNIPTQQVRDAMMLAPSAGAPAAGSIDEHLDDILVDTGTTLPALVAGLDGATVTVVSSVSGGTISVHVADTWLFTVTSAQLGLDVYESLGLVVKRSERQPDDAALLLLRTGTGLVRIGGAAPASAASGELTYDNTSFTGRVGLAETQGLRAGQYRWWLKCFDTTPAPDEAFTVATGEFVLLAAGLEAVV